MKTKKEKFEEFQKKLEKNKKKIMWGSIWVILIAIGWGILVIVFPTYPMWGFYLCYIIFGFGAIVSWIEQLNMDFEKNKIHNPRQSKQNALRDFEKKYRDDIVYYAPQYSIPQEFNTIEHILINNSGKHPNKIIEIIKEELDDDVIWMEVYSKSSERTYWQYFTSWKWLKKIN